MIWLPDRSWACQPPHDCGLQTLCLYCIWFYLMPTWWQLEVILFCNWLLLQQGRLSSLLLFFSSDKNGVIPLKAKVQAIKDAPKPTNTPSSNSSAPLEIAITAMVKDSPWFNWSFSQASISRSSGHWLLVDWCSHDEFHHIC